MSVENLSDRYRPIIGPSWNREIDFLKVLIATEQNCVLNQDQRHRTTCTKIIFDLKSTRALKLSNKGPVKIYRVPRPGFGKNLPEKKSLRP